MNLRGIFLVSSAFFCLKEPEAAFRGFANFSLILLKSLFEIKTSPLISIKSGKSFDFICFGISFTVFKFSVISSPSIPSPLERPVVKIPFLYVKDDEIPSIFG